MIYSKGSTVSGELRDLSKVWQKVLEGMAAKRDSVAGWIKQQNFGQVIYIATSDFYNIAISAAKVTHLVCGLNSIAVTPSELMFGRRPPYDARIRTLAVIISTPEFAQETGWGVEKLKQMDPKAQIMSLELGEPKLEAGLAAVPVCLPELKDAAKMPVNCVSGALLACFVLVGWISGKQILLDELGRLPGILDEHLKVWKDKTQQLVLDKPANMVFLGSGPFEGVSREAAFLTTRIAGVPCSSNYFLEYRQGYYGCATNQTMIVGMISNTFKLSEEKVLADLAISRARRIALAEESSTELMTRCDDLLELKSGASEIARVLLMLPVSMYMVFYLSMSRGVNPDNPKHLEHPRMALKDRPGTK